MPSDSPPEAPRPRSLRRALPLILVAAFLIRAHACLHLGCIDRNGVQFVNFARQLALDPADAMRRTTRQPAFSILLLGAQRLLRPVLGDTPEAWQLAGHFLALLGGLAVVAAVYLLARRLFDDTTATIAAVFAALWPQGVELSSGVLSDMPHLALYLLALILAFDALTRPHPAHLAACGALCGLAYLFKQEALGLLAAISICWLWPDPVRSRRARALGFAVFLAAFVVVASPHSLMTGHLMPNKNPLDAARRLFSAAPPGDTAHVLAYFVSPWMAPGKLVEDWLRSGRYVIPTLFLVGLFMKSAPRAAPAGRRLALAAVLLHAALVEARVIVYGESSVRYAAIPAALCIPWAASALLHVLGALSARLPAERRDRAAALHVIGLLVCLAPLFAYSTRPQEEAKAHYPAAGRWLRENLAPDATVMAHENLEQLLFYANLIDPEPRWIKCPRNADLDALRPLLVQQRPDWFADARGSHHDELDEAAHFRRLAERPPPELTPAQAFGPANRRVLFFRVRQD